MVDREDSGDVEDWDPEDAWWDDRPTCTICDGLGHGYPGGGPCPLEERGEQGVPWWAE